MKKHWMDNPRDSADAGGEPVPARVPASFSIGPVEVRPATVLAPMAGVTDTIFRRFIRNASLFTPAGRCGTPRSIRKSRISSPAAA